MIRGMAALALTMVTGVPVAEETITTLFGMRRYAVNGMLLVVGQAVKDRGDETAGGARVPVKPRGKENAR